MEVAELAARHMHRILCVLTVLHSQVGCNENKYTKQITTLQHIAVVYLR